MHANPGARRVPVHPVDADIALDDMNEFVRDHPQGWLAQHISGTLVFGQSVVKGDFFLAQTGLLAARPSRPDVLGCPSSEYLRH